MQQTASIRPRRPRPAAGCGTWAAGRGPGTAGWGPAATGGRGRAPTARPG